MSDRLVCFEFYINDKVFEIRNLYPIEPLFNIKSISHRIPETKTAVSHKVLAIWTLFSMLQEGDWAQNISHELSTAIMYQNTLISVYVPEQKERLFREIQSIKTFAYPAPPPLYSPIHEKHSDSTNFVMQFSNGS